MDLREYGRVLFRRGWVIVVCALVGALGAFLFSRIQTPIYRSTITLSAVPARPDYGQGLAAKAFLRNYSLQIVSSTLLQQVIDEMKLDTSPEALRSRINVSSDEADLTITIEAKHPDIQTAQELPQHLGQDFVVKHRQDNLQIDQDNRILVELLDNAAPVEKFSPKTTINVIAGAILGALAGAFVVFLFEFIQSGYLRRSEDIERLLGLTVLGIIPNMTPKRVPEAREQTGNKPVSMPAAQPTTDKQTG